MEQPIFSNSLNCAIEAVDSLDLPARKKESQCFFNLLDFCITLEFCVLFLLAIDDNACRRYCHRTNQHPKATKRQETSLEQPVASHSMVAATAQSRVVGENLDLPGEGAAR